MITRFRFLHLPRFWGQRSLDTGRECLLHPRIRATIREPTNGCEKRHKDRRRLFTCPDVPDLPGWRAADCEHYLVHSHGQWKLAN
jgi:hypothetical protein